MLSIVQQVGIGFGIAVASIILTLYRQFIGNEGEMCIRDRVKTTSVILKPYLKNRDWKTNSIVLQAKLALT